MSKHSLPEIRPTDDELLLQFIQKADQRAFRTLVERHSPFVQSICRRILWHPQDVEDAFQATFLILARDAARIRCKNSLAGWLFQVAHRTAKRAALKRSQRRERPMSDDGATSDSPLATIEDREAFEVLAEELSRLPRKLQSALVLFYLQGRSRSGAAQELDCSEEALKSRLARGRSLLRSRLIRRGVSFSFVMAAYATTAQAAIPPLLLKRTVAAAVEYSATGQAGAHCSTQSVSLAEGITSMTTFTLTKSAAVLGAFLLFGLVAGGIRSYRMAALSGEPEPGAKSAATLQDLSSIVRETGPPERLTQVSFAAAIDSNKTEDAPAEAEEESEFADLKQRNPAERRIEQALMRPTEIEFVDLPLHDAIDYLSDLHDLPIIFDQVALDDEGVSTDEPITQTLSGVALQSALHIILDPLGLTYIIEDEVLKITSEIRESETTEVRVYPIEKLKSRNVTGEEVVSLLEKFTKCECSLLKRGELIAIKASQHEHRKIVDIIQQLQ